MKFMIMMNAPRATGDYQINSWAPEDFRNHMAFMHDINRQLIEAGEFASAEGLSAPGAAKLVRAGKDGLPVTDGVFAESKEFLAGFWIVEVESAERAYELAGRISAAPGMGGVPLNMPIEVRQVMKLPTPDA